MITWEQEFLEDNWHVMEDGKKLFSIIHETAGRKNWVVVDMAPGKGSPILSRHATEDGARIHVGGMLAARKPE